MTFVGQGTVLSGVSPARSSASAPATLNVEPGAYWPRVAVDRPSPFGPLAAASTSPVEGRIATRAAFPATGARIASAAAWSGTSRVVCSGAPATGSAWKSCRVTGPAVPTTVSPGVPRSCASYCRWRPESPVRSPATTAPPDPSTISLVACPTCPRIGRANSRVGASGSMPSTVLTPGIWRSVPTSYAGSSCRTVIASTNAFGPAAATFAA